MAAPMGPTPYCTARIFFFKRGSVALIREFAFAGVRGGEVFHFQIGANTLKQSRCAFNEIHRLFSASGDWQLVRRRLRADNA
jgi:hypothetical protein